MQKYYGRGKNKIQNPYTLPDMYKDYIKDKTPGTLQYLTYDQYKKIVCLFYKEVSNKVIVKGESFKMPNRLGKTYVDKKKLDYNNRPPVDWQMTNMMGRVIYNFNEHSGGFKYELKWDKKLCIFKNHYLYRLIYTRKNKRLVAELVKSKKMDYFER